MKSRRATYKEVRAAAFANPYYRVWGGEDEPPLPVYQVTLASLLEGILPGGRDFIFRRDAARTIDHDTLLRWGSDRRGHRRLLHPNGVCLFGAWQIEDDAQDYTGYFSPGSHGVVAARYSTCCDAVRSGRFRSLSLVATLFPTTDLASKSSLPTASLITQEDLGGERHTSFREAVLTNAPNTTAWRRGLHLNGLPVLALTGAVFRSVDQQPTHRQLYEIAELGKPTEQTTRCPEFLRLVVHTFKDEEGPGAAEADFRDELLGAIYDPGDPTARRSLTFGIDVSDHGVTRGAGLFQRRYVKNWRRIGKITFHEAVASYNGDFVLHFHHPAWRNDRNDALTATRGSSRLTP